MREYNEMVFCLKYFQKVNRVDFIRISTFFSSFMMMEWNTFVVLLHIKKSNKVKREETDRKDTYTKRVCIIL